MVEFFRKDKLNKIILLIFISLFSSIALSAIIPLEPDPFNSNWCGNGQERYEVDLYSKILMFSSIIIGIIFIVLGYFEIYKFSKNKTLIINKESKHQKQKDILLKVIVYSTSFIISFSILSIPFSFFDELYKDLYQDIILNSPLHYFFLFLGYSLFLAAILLLGLLLNYIFMRAKKLTGKNSKGVLFLIIGILFLSIVFTLRDFYIILGFY